MIALCQHIRAKMIALCQHIRAKMIVLHHMRNPQSAHSIDQWCFGFAGAVGLKIHTRLHTLTVLLRGCQGFLPSETVRCRQIGYRLGLGLGLGLGLAGIVGHFQTTQQGANVASTNRKGALGKWV